MVKCIIFLVFISCLVQSHSLYAIGADAADTIKDIEDQKIIETEGRKWTGIDVSIVGKYAEKYGHPPRDPYINTDQGDLLLFVFTFFGFIGGIIIGYNFRKLFVEGKDKHHSGI